MTGDIKVPELLHCAEQLITERHPRNPATIPIIVGVIQRILALNLKPRETTLDLNR
jgi:hypothetical protein